MAFNHTEEDSYLITDLNRHTVREGDLIIFTDPESVYLTAGRSYVVLENDWGKLSDWPFLLYDDECDIIWFGSDNEDIYKVIL